MFCKCDAQASRVPQPTHSQCELLKLSALSGTGPEPGVSVQATHSGGPHASSYEVHPRSWAEHGQSSGATEAYLAHFD